MGSSVTKTNEDGSVEYDLTFNSSIVKNYTCVLSVYKTISVVYFNKMIASLGALPNTCEFIFVFYGIDTTTFKMPESRFQSKIMGDALVVYSEIKNVGANYLEFSRTQSTGVSNFKVFFTDEEMNDSVFWDAVYIPKKDDFLYIDSGPKKIKSSVLIDPNGTSEEGMCLMLEIVQLQVNRAFLESETYIVDYYTDSLNRIVSHLFSLYQRNNIVLIYKFGNASVRYQNFFHKMCTDLSTIANKQYIKSEQFYIIGKGISLSGKTLTFSDRTIALDGVKTKDFYIENEVINPTSIVLGKSVKKFTNVMDQAAEIFKTPNGSLSWTSAANFSFVIFYIKSDQMKILFLLLENKNKLNKYFIMVLPGPLDNAIIKKIGDNPTLNYVNINNVQFVHNIENFANGSGSIFMPLAFRMSAVQDISKSLKMLETNELLFTSSSIKMINQPKGENYMPILGTSYKTSGASYFSLKPLLLMTDDITKDDFLLISTSTTNLNLILHLVRQLDYQSYNFAIVCKSITDANTGFELPNYTWRYISGNFKMLCKSEFFDNTKNALKISNEVILTVGNNNSDINFYFGKTPPDDLPDSFFISESLDEEFKYSVKNTVNFTLPEDTIVGGPIDPTVFLLKKTKRATPTMDPINVKLYPADNKVAQVVIVRTRTVESFLEHCKMIETFFSFNAKTTNIYMVVTFKATKESETKKLGAFKKVLDVYVAGFMSTQFTDSAFYTGILTINNKFPIIKFKETVTTEVVESEIQIQILDKKHVESIAIPFTDNIKNITTSYNYSPIKTTEDILMFTINQNLSSPSTLEVFKTNKTATTTCVYETIDVIYHICDALNETDLNKGKFVLMFSNNEKSIQITNIKSTIEQHFTKTLKMNVNLIKIRPNLCIVSNDSIVYTGGILSFNDITIGIDVFDVPDTDLNVSIAGAVKFAIIPDYMVRSSSVLYGYGNSPALQGVQLNNLPKNMEYLSKTQVFNRSAGITVLPNLNNAEIIQFNNFLQKTKTKDIFVSILDRAFTNADILSDMHIVVLYNKNIYRNVSGIKYSDFMFYTFNISDEQYSLYFKFAIWTNSVKYSDVKDQDRFKSYDLDFVINKSFGVPIGESLFVHANERAGVMDSFFNIKNLDENLFPTIASAIKKKIKTVGFVFPLPKYLDSISRIKKNQFVIAHTYGQNLSMIEIIAFTFARINPVAMIFSVGGEIKNINSAMGIEFDTFTTSDITYSLKDFYKIGTYGKNTVYSYKLPSIDTSTFIKFKGDESVLISKVMGYNGPGISPLVSFPYFSVSKGDISTGTNETRNGISMINVYSV